MGNVLLNIFKFVLAIILIPVMYTTVITFQSHLISYPKTFTEAFAGGVITCLFVFLFLYQFWAVYELEHSMTSGIFKFLTPFDKWIAYVLPTFYVLTMLLLFIIFRVGKIDGMEEQMTFIGSLLLCMHILVLSQDLQNPEKGLTKPTYLVVLALTVIISCFAAVFMMDMVTGKNTFARFSRQWLGNTQATYSAVVEKASYFK